MTCMIACVGLIAARNAERLYGRWCKNRWLLVVVGSSFVAPFLILLVLPVHLIMCVPEKKQKGGCREAHQTTLLSSVLRRAYLYCLQAADAAAYSRSVRSDRMRVTEVCRRKPLLTRVTSRSAQRLILGEDVTGSGGRSFIRGTQCAYRQSAQSEPGRCKRRRPPLTFRARDACSRSERPRTRARRKVP